MATEFSDEELRELYAVLGSCQQALKSQEIAQAALKFTDKPTSYSPLVKRLMAVRNDVGEKVAQLPQQS